MKVKRLREDNDSIKNKIKDILFNMPSEELVNKLKDYSKYVENNEGKFTCPRDDHNARMEIEQLSTFTAYINKEKAKHRVVDFIVDNFGNDLKLPGGEYFLRSAIPNNLVDRLISVKEDEKQAKYKEQDQRTAKYGLKIRPANAAGGSSNSYSSTGRKMVVLEPKDHQEAVKAVSNYVNPYNSPLIDISFGEDDQGRLTYYVTEYND